MTFGVVFPQTDFGGDAAAVRDFAQTIEGLGFKHVVAYDHVVGANPDRPGGWKGPYTYMSSFLEPFVLFSFMAATAPKLGFLTGIIILPQRQTALVAKQAATLDVLCNGKLRLGVGIGWNDLEYTALGEDFHTRGKRMDEQIQVLRMLWTKPLVNYSGTYHELPDVGIRPLPIQQPIPIWFGGSTAPALQRIAALGDGWLPNFNTCAQARPVWDELRNLMQAAGRNPELMDIEPRVPLNLGGEDKWLSEVEEWKAAGARRISINTLGMGYSHPQEHLDAIQRFAKAAGMIG
jgi:probable F420-dependent oxidoreductase